MDFFDSVKEFSPLDAEPGSRFRSEWLASEQPNNPKDSELRLLAEKAEQGDSVELKFDYTPVGRRLLLVSITLPDGGKVSRKTEALDGRDGQEGGMRVLKGYELPNGELLEKSIQRNSDGTISLFDIDNENRLPDRHEIRMSPAEFIKFVREYKRN